MRLLPWWIGLFALIVRLLYLFESYANPFRTHLNLDLKYYHQWAETILGGQPFGPDVFMQAPLYPYVVAGCYALTGPDPLAPLWLQAVLGALTALLGARIAGQFWGRPAMLATGLLLALYKPGIFYTGVLLVPVVAACLLALAFTFARRHPLLGGIVTGLTGLAHPVLLPGALVMTAGTAILGYPSPSSGRRAALGDRSPSSARPRAWRRPLLLVLLGTLLAIAPATIHNWIYSGRFVAVSANAGINLYIGNGPDANGFYTSPFGLRAERDLLGIGEASYQAGRDLSVVESSRFWIARTLETIHENPGRATSLYLRKVYFTLFGFEIPQVESFDFEKRYSFLLRIPFLPNWLLLIALGGFALVFLRRSPVAWVWSAGTILTVLLIAVFFATGRFRLPLHVPLALLAGGGIAALIAHLRGGVLVTQEGPGASGAVPAGRTASLARLTPAPLPAALAVAAALLLLLAPGWFQVQKEVTFAQYHYRLGVIAEEAGRADEAMEEYATTLRIDPKIARAAVNLGILHARQGRLERAQPLLERGVDLDPRSAIGFLSLGQIHQIRGDLDRATQLYGRAWEADTSYVRALESLAVATYLRGRIAAAESLAVELVRREEPDAPLARRCVFLLNRITERRNHGLSLWSHRELAEADLAFAVGDLQRAKAGYRAALKEAPGDRVALLEMGRCAALAGESEEAARLFARYREAGGPMELLPR
ncbi:MAG: tetratricopeptide repeat protein [Candidatus Eisenbacteria sp.]|nr:tetratricopeptide repeat protein [Candidatus Eisenbacteria bacterium]